MRAEIEVRWQARLDTETAALRVDLDSARAALGSAGKYVST